MKRWFRISIFLVLAISLQPIRAQYIQHTESELYMIDFSTSLRAQSPEPWARKGKETDDCFHMVTLYTWLKDAPGIQIGLPKGGFVWYGRREIGQVLPLIKGLRDRLCKKKEKE